MGGTGNMDGMAVRVLIAREAVVTRGDKTAMEGRRISTHPAHH